MVNVSIINGVDSNNMTVKTHGEIPVDLMKQDPNTGMWRLGGIEMTGGEYAISLAFNELKKEMLDLHSRMTRIENK